MTHSCEHKGVASSAYANALHVKTMVDGGEMELALNWVNNPQFLMLYINVYCRLIL